MSEQQEQETPVLIVQAGVATASGTINPEHEKAGD
jgi:hypothetical protein